MSHKCHTEFHNMHLRKIVWTVRYEWFIDLWQYLAI